MSCGECKVDVSGIISFRRYQLCPKSRFVEVGSKRRIIHRSSFPDEDGDVEDVVFAG
jgi:hypothetical protein